MDRLSVENLRFLFDFIEPKANQIIWLRDKTYSKQWYVSPCYQNYWGQKNESLFEHPESWNDFLYNEDKLNILKHTEKRKSPDHPDIDKKVFFRIINTKNEIKYVTDNPFILTDKDNNNIGFGGIGEVVTPEQWHDEINHRASFNPIDRQLKKDVFNILENEFGLLTNEMPQQTPLQAIQRVCILKNNKQIVNLTPREIDCVFYLLAGKTTKQAAAEMNISVRTVEFHFGNIKIKTNSRSKLELVRKIELIA